VAEPSECTSSLTVGGVQVGTHRILRWDT
jgi:hypothetical protein